MKEQKQASQKSQKVAVKADKAIAAYGIINRRSDKQAGTEGFKISSLQTKDIFVFLRARNALKPIAEAYADFERDANESLKPADWNDIVEKSQKFADLSDAQKAEINKAIIAYRNNVSQCISSELEKDKDIDAYEHLSEDAFGLLVKENPHLDAIEIALLQEILA